MAPLVVITRVAFAVEFVAALATWSLGICHWMVAGAVATSALTVSMLMWGERGTLRAREPEPLSCALFGCDLPDRGPCHRCGRW